MKNGNEATAAVAGALEAAGIDYLLAGSYSANYYGNPRATRDADFVIQRGQGSFDDFLGALGTSFVLDPQMSFETVTGTYRQILEVTGLPFKIELFELSEDPHDQSRFERRVAIVNRVLERSIYLPTPEDVIVTKLRWVSIAIREKDADDIRNVLAVQWDTLDWDYIHHWADIHGTRETLDQIRDSIPPLD